MRHRSLLPAITLLLGLCSPVHSAFVVDIDQVGSDVVVVGAGAFDLTGLTKSSGRVFVLPYLESSESSLGVGSVRFDEVDAYRCVLLGPSSFGAMDNVFPDSGSGDKVALDRPLSQFVVPLGYVSGSDLFSTNTYNNRSLASLGLTPGATFIYTYAATATGPTIDTFTIRIGQGGAVPEPASLVMVAVGLAGVGFVVRRQR